MQTSNCVLILICVDRPGESRDKISNNNNKLLPKTKKISSAFFNLGKLCAQTREAMSYLMIQYWESDMFAQIS